MLHRALTTIAALTVLAACSTPDIDRFAAQSGQLASAVATESSETSRHLSSVAARADDRLDDESADALASLAAEYSNNARVVDGLLHEAARYADAIAELAAAGETGGEAADRIAGSVSRFASVTGQLVPGTELVSGTVLDVANAVGKAWTRIEAQNDLREVIETTAGEGGAVALVADGIAEIYGRGGPQQRLIEEIYDLERVMIRDEAGAQMVGLYEQLTDTSLEAMYRDTWLTCFFEEQGDLNPDCMTGERFRELAAVHEIVSNLEPRYRQYSRELADLRSWRSRRLSNAAAIVRAVEAWKDEHDEIAERLDTCGGWRPLHGDCGDLGGESLQGTIDSLKSLVEED